MNIVLFGLSERFLDGLIKQLEKISGTQCYLCRTYDPSLFERAQVLVASSWPDGFEDANHLELIQASGAGVEKLNIERIPCSVPVANCFGHEASIGEYVVAAILRHAIPVDKADKLLRQKQWDEGIGSKKFRGSVIGKKIGVLGYGHVGRVVTQLAVAHGMNAIIANRTRVTELQSGCSFLPLQDVNQLYQEADYVVCTLPLTNETRSFVDHRAFGRMKQSAVLINVGRGPVVNERDLYQALQARQIEFAFIDAWYNYPASLGSDAAPSSYEFESLNNVVMTPHMSAWTEDTIKRRQAQVVENVRRLADGRPLLNLVDRH